MSATQPFDFAQGHEPVEWQMDVFQQPGDEIKGVTENENNCLYEAGA